MNTVRRIRSGWICWAAASVLAAVVSSGRAAEDGDSVWRANIGFNPLVHGGAGTPEARAPDQIAGLALWLDAAQGVATDEAGRVAAWKDRSSAGRTMDMAQADVRPEGVVARAINGLPAVRFAGRQEFGQALMVDGLPAAGATGMTVIAVARADRDGFGMNKLLHFGPDAPPQSLVMGFLHARVDEPDYGDGPNSGQAVIGTGFRLMSVIADTQAGSLQLALDGSVTREVKRPIALKSPELLRIGASRPGRNAISGGMDGQLAELVIFDRPLPDAERVAVERYLAEKYGLRQAGRSARWATQLAYAWFPTKRELEVAFDANTFFARLKQPAPEDLRGMSELTVYVGDTAKKRAPVRRTLPLDRQGLGHGAFTLPELEPGRYEVVYELAGHKLTSERSFVVERFDFERNRLGLDHRAYAPFLPVKVKDKTVEVVDRKYVMNGFGMFDSVISLDQELLAEPVQLVAQTDAGPVVWGKAKIGGKAEFEDLAVFTGQVEGGGIAVQSRTEIEEDGCARVRLTYGPAEKNKPVNLKRMVLRMAVPRETMPLCHLAGLDSMRHNYAGNVPEGGTIEWMQQTWRPARWKATPFEGKTPERYPVWQARDQMHWSKREWSFAPYVWLGQEERGIAWFGDHIGGYEVEDRQGYGRSIQWLYREGDKVVLEVEIAQRPCVLDKPRTIEFGLQASPTKPMPADWRGYAVPGGGGMMVVVWGGYFCNDKYPDPKDWSLVEKIVAGRGSQKVDKAFFESLDKRRKWPHLKVHGEHEWLDVTLGFAGREASQPHPNGITVYFEEHVTHPILPEFIAYQDEWCDTDFTRFRADPGWPEGNYWNSGGQTHGGHAPSYRDFAVYYADQWMRRGVGIYYDNTYPRVFANPYHLPASDISWCGTLFAQRDYYKRVWKRSRELMEKGQTPVDPATGRPMRLHTVGHITNCQLLPFTTWWDASLGVEQPYQKDADGSALPFPPDYLRAMECGRMAGIIPHYRHLLRNQDALGGLGHGFGVGDEGRAEDVRRHRELSDAGMGTVHEIRGGVSEWDNPAVRVLRAALRDSGYGRAGVAVHNYWDEKPFAAVGNPDVKWLGIENPQSEKPSRLLVLQSYRAEATTTTVRVPGTAFFADALTRETFAADGDGVATVPLAADYGTRVLLAAESADALSLVPTRPGTLHVEDAQLGLSVGTAIGGVIPKVVADEHKPGNLLFRYTPGHPAQNLLGISNPALDAQDYRIEFKFRLADQPATNGSQGLLRVGYRCRDGQRYGVAVKMAVAADGSRVLSVDEPRLVAAGGNSRAMQATVTTGRSVPVRLDIGPQEWHTFTVLAQGEKHRILLDGTVCYEGTDNGNLSGGLEIAPDWNLKQDSPVTAVEVDDIVVTRLRENL
jgi:hypothetical protein